MTRNQMMTMLSAMLVATSLPTTVNALMPFTDLAHHSTAFVDHIHHSQAWTSSSLATAVTSSNPLANLLDQYKQSLLTHPLPTKMATGAALAVAGDAIAQSREVDTPYDKSRAASFAVFDMCYRALQHAAFPLIVAECQGQYIGSLLQNTDLVPTEYMAAMEQTLASQLGIVPFLYYPVFFSLTGVMQGLSGEGIINRAKENFVPLMKRNLLFWIPVQFVQFGFVEESLQIPFLSMCGLAWTFILSVMAGSAKSYDDKNNANNDEKIITSNDASGSDPSITVVYDDSNVITGRPVKVLNSNTVQIPEEMQKFSNDTLVR